MENKLPLTGYHYVLTLISKGYVFMGDKADWSEEEKREWKTQVNVNQSLGPIEIKDWGLLQTHVLHGERMFATNTGARTY